LAWQTGAEFSCASADEFRALCFQKTGGVGVDSVVITAETPSSKPVNLAAEIARDRAIVVAVGTVGMDIDRQLYFGKELDRRESSGVRSPERIAVVEKTPATGSIGIGVLGAGNFAQSVLLPALKSIPRASLVGVCNATGPRSKNAAEKFRFQYCTDSQE